MMLRLIIAMAITLLPAASLAAGETWTPVGTTVQPEKKTSLSLVFDTEEIRGHAAGCSALACQIVMPMSWEHRAKFAERWYNQCKNALVAAHAGSADWNFRDLQVTKDRQWLTVPSGGEQNGARFLCLKQERKAERAPVLPPVSVAPVDGDRAETFDTRVSRVEPPVPPPPPKPIPTAAVTPPISTPEPPPGRSRSLIDASTSSMPSNLKQVTAQAPEVTTSSASERLLRVVAGACASARWDTGYSEMGVHGCVVLGAELRVWKFLAGLDGELFFQPGGNDTLGIGGTGHLSLVLGSLGGLELGPYLRLRPVLLQEEGQPAKHYVDWGVRLGIPLYDGESLSAVLVLHGSLGSRARLAEQHFEGYFNTSGDTLGFGGGGALVLRVPIL